MPEVDGDGVSIRIDAPAKINLYLHVTARRADGFHELDSLFVRVGVADRLTIKAADDLSFTVDGPFSAGLATDDDQDNLVLAAARLLASGLDRTPAVALHLVKNLPVAAGLGGGSADAAATLKGLVALWQSDVTSRDLQAIAMELGADVPACLDDRPQQVAGIGEILRPAPDLPSAWLVLVNPGIELLTADVFRAFDGAFSPPMPLDKPPADAAALAQALHVRGNDLEGAAIAVVPDIAKVLQVLGGEVGVLVARMSGSGATCFGLTAGASEAEAVASRIKDAKPDWWVATAPILTGGS